MNESDFDNYNVRKWLDKGLSRHPGRQVGADAPSEESPTSAWPLAKLILPLAAVAIMGTAGQSVAANVRPQSSPVQFSSATALSNWILPVADTSTRGSVVAGFESAAVALLHQLKSGSISNVPSETYRLAAEVKHYTPSADGESWIKSVASDLSKLND